MLPEQRNFQHAYEQAWKLALRELSQIDDLEGQCRKSGARLELVSNKKVLTLDYLNQPYLITLPDGGKLLYALDTGYYTDETWEYLRGRQTDTLIMDCTFAGRTDRGEYPSGHLDGASFVKMLEKMNSSGFIGPRTKIFATHFNPHQGLTHDGIQEFFDRSAFSVTVAYDGLRFEA